MQSDNPIVRMEKAICPVCGERHETGAILIARSLRVGIPKGKETTHFALCPKHQQMHDDGYVALVEVQREPEPGEGLYPPRTGHIAHVRRSKWKLLFNESVPVPEIPMIFVQAGVVAALKGFVDIRSEESQ